MLRLVNKNLASFLWFDFMNLSMEPIPKQIVVSSYFRWVATKKKMREMNQGYNSCKCGSTDNNENHKGTLLAVILTNWFFLRNNVFMQLHCMKVEESSAKYLAKKEKQKRIWDLNPIVSKGNELKFRLRWLWAGPLNNEGLQCKNTGNEIPSKWLYKSSKRRLYVWKRKAVFSFYE